MNRDKAVRHRNKATIAHLAVEPWVDTMKGSASQKGDLGPQYLVAIIVNILSFVYGMALGWPAPMQPLLQARFKNANATVPSSFWDSSVTDLTDEGMSWIAALLCIGGMVGTPLFGFCANAVGRKKSLILSAIPFLVSYSLIGLASNPMYLYMGRILAGLGGAGVLCIVPMYIGETAEDSIRGVLSSYLNVFICSGILASYVIGSYASYMTLVLICLTLNVIFFILIMWLPESPVYSLINDRPDEAYRSLTKLRGNYRDLVEHQVNTISSAVKEMTSNSSGSVSIKEIISDPPTRKALIIVLTLLTVQQASGITPIINYTVAIFEASGSQLSPTIAAIIVGALQVVGALLGMIFIDRAGRKFLLMLSFVGMAITLSPIAYFMYLNTHGADPKLLESIGWLPVTSMSIYIVVYALGSGPIPFVLMAEIFKTEAKSAASSISVAHLWITAFLYVKFFSNMSGALGIDICFAIFAACCAGGAIFTFFNVTETKGKSLERILSELGGSPPGSRGSPVPFFEGVGDNITLQSQNKTQS